MSDAAYASLVDLGIDGLRQLVQQLDDLEAHPAWVYVRSLLAQQQRIQTNLLTTPPGKTTTDAYALRNAHLTGWVEGLQYTADLPQAARRITERVIEREQHAAVLAARAQEQYA